MLKACKNERQPITVMFDISPWGFLTSVLRPKHKNEFTFEISLTHLRLLKVFYNILFLPMGKKSQRGLFKDLFLF